MTHAHILCFRISILPCYTASLEIRRLSNPHNPNPNPNPNPRASQVWLGIGDALEEAIQGGQLPLLQDMYDNWPFFKVGVNLLSVKSLSEKFWCHCEVADREVAVGPVFSKLIFG